MDSPPFRDGQPTNHLKRLHSYYLQSFPLLRDLSFDGLIKRTLTRYRCRQNHVLLQVSLVALLISRWGGGWLRCSCRRPEVWAIVRVAVMSNRALSRGPETPGPDIVSARPVDEESVGPLLGSI